MLIQVNYKIKEVPRRELCTRTMNQMNTYTIKFTECPGDQGLLGFVINSGQSALGCIRTDWPIRQSKLTRAHRTMVRVTIYIIIGPCSPQFTLFTHKTSPLCTSFITTAKRLIVVKKRISIKHDQLIKRTNP